MINVEELARAIVDKIFEETHDGMSLADEHRTAIKCAEIEIRKHIAQPAAPEEMR